MAEPLHDYPLPEHPDATRRRLREQGDWPEAEEIFNGVYRHHTAKFRKGGNTRLTIAQRIEANKAAWSAVYQLYPVPADAHPLPSLQAYLQNTAKAKATKKLPPLTPAEHDRFDEIGNTADPSVDAVWVYHNIEKAEIRAMDCPSRGAWAMLGKARRDVGWFYEKIYRPIAQQLSKIQSAKSDEEYKPSKAEKMAVAELDGMIQEAVEASL